MPAFFLEVQRMLASRLTHPFARGQLVSREAAGLLVEYGEILVDDARVSLTAAQVVEQKLLAMMGRSRASSFWPSKNAASRHRLRYDAGPPQKTLQLALSARAVQYRRV
jgi:hypothetical protein